MIKEIIEIYKAVKEERRKRKAEEALKKKSLEQDIDLAFFSSWIKKVNDNPNLRVIFTMKSGTKLELETYEKKNDYEVVPMSGVEEIKWGE